MLGKLILTFFNRVLNRDRFFDSPQALMRAARKEVYPKAQAQEPKRQTRYTYTDGPMTFLAQQIVRGMQDAGYPAKIVWVFRSPEKQRELYARGRTRPGPKVTNARPWQSAHQFYEAADIIHPSKGWDVPEVYWDTLAAVVRTVAERFNVKLNHGHHWKFRDSAHVELLDWRTVRDELIQTTALEDGGMRPPNAEELADRFAEVLPDVWRERMRR